MKYDRDADRKFNQEINRLTKVAEFTFPEVTEFLLPKVIEYTFYLKSHNSYVT